MKTPPHLNSKNSSIQNHYFQNNNKNYNYYQIRINEPIQVKEKSVMLKVDVLSRNDTMTIGKSLVYLEKTSKGVFTKFANPEVTRKKDGSLEFKTKIGVRVEKFYPFPTDLNTMNKIRIYVNKLIKKYIL